MGGSAPFLFNAATSESIAEISAGTWAGITPLDAGDNGYWKVAACILIFGILLLCALIMREHRRGSGEEHCPDRIMMSAEGDQHEKKQDQSTEGTC